MASKAEGPKGSCGSACGDFDLKSVRQSVEHECMNACHFAILQFANLPISHFAICSRASGQDGDREHCVDVVVVEASSSSYI